MTSALPEGPAGEQADIAGAAGTSAQADRLPAATGTAAVAPPPAQRAAPDDAQQLRAEIERTREQLGSTVEQLVAKVDVKSRARAKAAELKGRARTVTAQAREQAAARAENARGMLAGKSSGTRQKAISAGQTGKGQLTQLQQHAVAVRQSAPDSMRQALAKGTKTAREQRVPLAVAAGVLTGIFLGLWQWRKRNR